MSGTDPGLLSRRVQSRRVQSGRVLGRRVLPLVAVAALVLPTAACSGTTPVADPLDGVPSAAAPPTASATPAPTSPGPLPLTGLPARSRKQQARALVAVAVRSGTGLGAPRGLDEAELVYVSFPSAGRQRALGLFQSTDADRVGPVTATRPIDSKLLSAVGAVLVHSGGTRGFLEQLSANGLAQWSASVHRDGFDLADDGSLYASTSVARAADGAAPARPGLLALADDGPDAGPARRGRVRIEVPGQDGAELRYDGDTRTWKGSIGQLPVTATNVVVQVVSYDPLVLPKSGGLVEGNPKPDGKGGATLLSGPRVDAGSWNRPGPRTSTSFVRRDGTPARLAAGTTWVLLVPSGTEVEAGPTS